MSDTISVRVFRFGLLAAGDRIAEQRDELSQTRDPRAELIIVRKIFANRREPADGVQIRSAKCHRCPQREPACRKQSRHQDARRKFGSDPQSLRSRRNRRGPRAIEASRQTDALIRQQSHDAIEIIRRNQNVAVIHQQYRMARLLSQNLEQADLAVRRIAGRKDHPDGQHGELRAKPFDLNQSGITSVRCPEDQLELGIFLDSVRPNCFIKLRIEAAYWLQN